MTVKILCFHNIRGISDRNSLVYEGNLEMYEPKSDGLTVGMEGGNVIFH
jgi:hypothetical protein